MIRLGPALALVLLSCSCGGGDVAVDESGSCADLIVWEGREYTGSGVRAPAPLGEPLGRGERRPCDEAGGAVALVRVRGVDPQQAVGTPGDPLHVYVESGLIGRTAVPQALESILLGPPCAPAEPFAVAGTFVGSSNLDVPHSVTIDVDETDGPGRPYLGLMVTILVRDDTEGLRERSDFLRFAPVSARTRRLRATIRCAVADRPDETFVAMEIRAADPEPPYGTLPLPCVAEMTGPPCGRGAELGVSYPYDLYTHCGVEHAVFDGRLWVLDPPLDDGSGNPPPGWGNPFQRGLMRLVAEDVAEFRTARLNVRFEPAPADYERPGCA